MARLSLFLSVLLASSTPVWGSPLIAFPINSQVPPVARLGQAYSFVFSTSTFSTTSKAPITYTLVNPPAWLNIDSASRRIYGTPKDTDMSAGSVVGVPIVLLANDGTGTTSMSVTLVVSRNPPPTIQIPVSEQMQRFGAYSAPSTILSYPQKSFSFAFDPKTFSGTGLTYYAVSESNEPLPAWLNFDVASLTFSGFTPPFASLITPPQTFGVKLIASDVVGFSAVSADFSIVVGTHVLSATQPSVDLSATIGTPLTYNGLAGNIRIDGAVAKASDIVQVNSPNIPSWLTLNLLTWQLSGTPPTGAASTSFMVVFEDASADTLSISFEIIIGSANAGAAAGADGTSTSVFIDTLPSLTAVPSQHLTFDLKSHLRNASDIQVNAFARPAISWVNFDPTSMVLDVQVPNNTPSATIAVSFDVHLTSLNKNFLQTIPLSIKSTIPSSSSSSATTTTSVKNLSAQGTATAAATTTTYGSQATQDATSSPASNSSGYGINHLLLAILLPLFLVLALLVILSVWLYRRRRRQQRRRSLAPMKKHISWPLPNTFVHFGEHQACASLSDIGKQFDQASTLMSSPIRMSVGAEKPPTIRERSTLRYSAQAPPVPPIPGDGDRARSDIWAAPSIAGHDSWMTRLSAYLGPVRHMRFPSMLRKSRARLSDPSLYDENPQEVREVAVGQPPRLFLEPGTQSSFRSDLEISIPTIAGRRSSVQPTPEEVYKLPPCALKRISVHAPQISLLSQTSGFRGKRHSRILESSAVAPPSKLPPPPPVLHTSDRMEVSEEDRPGTAESFPLRKDGPARSATKKSSSSARSFVSVDTFREQAKRAVARARLQRKRTLQRVRQELQDESNAKNTAVESDAAQPSPRISHVRSYLSPRLFTSADPGPEPQIPPIRHVNSRSSNSFSSRGSRPASTVRARFSRQGSESFRPHHAPRYSSTASTGSGGKTGHDPLGISHDREMSPDGPAPGPIKPGLAKLGNSSRFGRTAEMGESNNWTLVEESPVIKQDWRKDSNGIDMQAMSRWPTTKRGGTTPKMGSSPYFQSRLGSVSRKRTARDDDAVAFV